MHLEVVNWGKYNQRKDVTNPSWFRLNNNIFDGETFFNLTNEERLLFIYVLCQRSKSNKDLFFINLNVAAALFGVKPINIESIINKLEENKMVTITRNGDVTPALRERDVRVLYTTEQNRTIHNTIAQTEFERVYSLFPRKEGKKRGLEIMKRLVKGDPNKLPLIEKAIVNYAAQCKDNRTEERFIKHFSTFINVWEDFLDINAASEKKPRKNCERCNNRGVILQENALGETIAVQCEGCA